LYINRGFWTASDSSMQNNTADVGRTIYGEGGTPTYILPTPPGSWLPAQQCQIYREGCQLYDTACENAAAECATIPLSTATAASGQACESITFSQPCDWSNLPALVGEHIYPLPLGPYEEDIPFPCAPGLLGGNISTTQRDSTCAGRCPAGFVCGSNATFVPLICAPCRVGSFKPVTTPLPPWCIDIAVALALPRAFRRR
jgi:hypothetical protein